MAALLALLSSGLWGVSDFVGGSLSRRLPVPLVVAGSQLAALLVLLPLAAATGAFGAAPGYLVPGVLAGAAGLIGLSAFYRALSLGTMGVVAPIAALGVAVPVLVALAAGERPAPAQYAGMAVAVVGVVLASGPELSGRAGAVPLLLAAVAAVGFGTVYALVAAGSEGDVRGVLMTLLAMRVTGTTLLAPVLLRALLRARAGAAALGRRDLPVLLAIGAADVGANGTYGLATRLGLVSVVAVLASLYPVVTAALAYRLLGERLRPVQAVGAAVTLAGVVLLAAG